MPTVAEQLRAAREAKKLTVQQVADATKIRTDHIRALEEGNFNLFSAPIYIRGSVKNYATMLKLNVPQLMLALDEAGFCWSSWCLGSGAGHGISTRAPTRSPICNLPFISPTIPVTHCRCRRSNFVGVGVTRLNSKI